MKVKICGLKTPVEIDICIKAKVDFIGFVFFKNSSRHLTFEKASELSGHYNNYYSNSNLKKVALCVNPTNGELSNIIASSNADILQLHGTETPFRVEEIRQKYALPVIKAIRVKNKTDIIASKQYSNCTDWLLFDATASSNLPPGGNGECFDWSLMKNFECDLPWMLAGGLNPNNVAGAIAECKPSGVDVSSGVEIIAGKKDPSMISAFVQSAKMS